MKSSRFYLLCALVIAAVSSRSGLSAQRAPVGPHLGFIQNASGTAIWPIIGIPGASAFGERILVDASIHAAVISSAKEYALAIRDEDGAVVVFSLNEPSSLTEIPGTPSNPDALALSPTGSAAAVYNAATRSIAVIKGLPRAPEILQEFSVYDVAGHLANMAVSDDGTIALVNLTSDEDARTALWIVDSSGPRPLGSEGSTAPSFFPNRHDAIIADDATQTAYLLTNVDQEAGRESVLSTADGLEVLSNVSVSGDGHAALVADNRTGTIAIIAMETRRPEFVNCQCKLTGLDRLQRNQFFQLTTISDEPVSVLDASPGESRVLIIPPMSPERRTQP